MSGFILHQGATITCPHTSGQARPDQTDVHVSLSGQALMTVARTYSIELCPQNTPCTKATWIKGATRVTASGLPVAIHNGQSMCVPPGELKPVFFQQKVSAE
jgi:hypothetical protein